MNEPLLEAARFFTAQKAVVIRLIKNGKIPCDKAWQNQKILLDTTLERYVEMGHNLGVRTGDVFAVVDVDIYKGGKFPGLPETPVVRTARGGEHWYYRVINKRIFNSVGKIAPHVDVRGIGGFVVAPGSIIDGHTYQWIDGRSPKDLPFAPFPLIVEEATLIGETKLQVPPGSKPISYTRNALASELGLVVMASEGRRNDQLNRSAFAIGQLVAYGNLSREEARDKLIQAGLKSGLDEKEVIATVESGLSGGMEKPRSQSLVPMPVRVLAKENELAPEILIPGQHVDDIGDLHEINLVNFCKLILSKIPNGVLYRRGRIVGQIVKGKFEPVNVHQMRLIVDAFVRLFFQKHSNDGGMRKTYVNTTRDLADVILEYASDNVPEVDMITTYPVYDEDMNLLQSGYHAKSKIYVDCEEILPIKDVVLCRKVIEDLVVDFPFEDAVSRENFLSFLLTPVVRKAIKGNCPMCLIHAPQERCGKTKLVDEVTGGVYLGGPMPAMQLGTDEAERDKRITTLVSQAYSFCHFDNVGEFLHSPALASLVTAEKWSGRILGQTRIMEFTNYMILFATANNPKMTAELAKRCISVALQPSDSEPEFRTAFAHPNLRAYVAENRKVIIAAILGLWEHWLANGRPNGNVPLGGFEGWSRMVGGCMQLNGYTKWNTKMREWVQRGDQYSADMREFAKLCIKAWGDRPVLAQLMFRLAIDHDLFDYVMGKPTERGQMTAFCKTVLVKSLGRIYYGHKLTRVGGATGREYAWEKFSASGEGSDEAPEYPTQPSPESPSLFGQVQGQSTSQPDADPEEQRAPQGTP